MSLFAIKAIVFGRDDRRFCGKPQEMQIDSERVVLACPVSAQMRGIGMAPITARTCVIFADEEGNNRIVYLQDMRADWLRGTSLATSSEPEAVFLRECAQSGKISTQELTPGLLQEEGIILMQDPANPGQQVIAQRQRNFV